MPESHPYTRREFLKLLALVSAGGLLPYHMMQAISPARDPAAPNILIIVFDTWSAPHCSLYGHTRLTTPNLERLADRAVVFHHHIAGGNYTLPGTTSMLTGLLPWSHRAFDYPLDKVKRHFVGRSLFRLFEDYERLVYTHNPLAEFLLQTMLEDIDAYTRRFELMLDGDVLVNRLFSGDLDAASLAWLRTVKPRAGELNYSLYFSRLYDSFQQRRLEPFLREFPLGLPTTNFDDHFVLEDAIDWAAGQAAAKQSPFFGYYHFLPPHHPYHTRVDFFQRFSKDGRHALEKPEHLFTQGVSYERLDEQSRWYDEFILYVDAEFGRLHGQLEDSGILENTWIILTSDHGELFERGIRGHNTPVLFEPVVHVPLLVFPPGQAQRVDVYETTSAADLLPTLLHIAGKDPKIAPWTEGRVLPPFGSEGEVDVFSVESKNLKPNQPMDFGTAALWRGPWKLVYYWGYPEMGETGEKVELFNLAEDPDELHDLAAEQPEIMAGMHTTIREKITGKDRPFAGG